MFNHAQLNPGDESIKAKLDGGQELKHQAEAGSTCSRALLFELPPVISNSSLVLHQASAKELLVAASVNTAASLPLMIGGRSKCVLNIVEEKSRFDNQVKVDESSVAPGMKAIASHTANRAHQRKRNNMISVVRPVVTSTIDSSSYPLKRSSLGDQVSSCLIEDMMGADLSRILRRELSDTSALPAYLDTDNSASFKPAVLANEYELKQQQTLLRREEFELSRGIKRQHEYIVAKLGDRKRNLLIIQSVWSQRDFRCAIEKLVDIYHQGLVFSCEGKQMTAATTTTIGRQEQASGNLSSLNTSLVVDVLSVITLRPKLWNLEICQLLLPIIINDLLLAHGQSSSAASPKQQLRARESQNKVKEVYLDVAIKSLRLIVSQFGSLIRNTIESQKDSSRLAGGVDLSREERVNRCLTCYALLDESQRALASLTQEDSNHPTSRRSQIKELEHLLASLFKTDCQRNLAKTRRN